MQSVTGSSLAAENASLILHLLMRGDLEKAIQRLKLMLPKR
jgi:hypothetical protein